MPTVLLVTLTVTVQLLLAGMVPALKATLAPLAAAVTVPPVQLVLAAGAAALTRLAG